MTDASARLPASYRPVTWRSTTPVDPASRQIGVSFQQEDGTVVRVAFGLDCARHLGQSMADYLERFQSSMSSGIPSADVSIPREGVEQ